MAQDKQCAVCGRTFDAGRNGRRRTDSRECARKHAAALQKQWRLNNPEKVRKYSGSLAHIASNKRYQKTEKYRAYQIKYRTSERGRAAQRKYRAKRRGTRQ